VGYDTVLVPRCVVAFRVFLGARPVFHCSEGCLAVAALALVAEYFTYEEQGQAVRDTVRFVSKVEERLVSDGS
jgi:hypothetical protein